MSVGAQGRVREIGARLSLLRALGCRERFWGWVVLEEGRLDWRRSGPILGMAIEVAFLGRRLVDFVEVDFDLLASVWRELVAATWLDGMGQSEMLENRGYDG